MNFSLHSTCRGDARRVSVIAVSLGLEHMEEQVRLYSGLPYVPITGDHSAPLVRRYSADLLAPLCLVQK
eukprot:SAG11_NODE_35106_length_268_cov_0.905325_1_plen_68_part_01